MTSPQVICMGEAMVEFVKSDNDAHHPHYRQGVGGDTSNAAIAAARQGASVGFLSSIGTDDFGASVLGCWRKEGIDTCGVVQSETDPTGIYFVDPQPEVRRFTYYRKGSAASRMRPDQIDEQLISRSRVLHLSGISLAISETARETCFAAVRMARKHNVLVSFDINHRSKLWSDETALRTVHDLLPMVDIFFPSLDEAEDLTGVIGADAVLDYFAKQGASQQCLKMGNQGCLLDWNGSREVVPAFNALAIDSTGAGDSFAGAFLARFLEANDAQSAALYGCATAAITVSGHGAVTPLPGRMQVEELIRKQGRHAAA